MAQRRMKSTRANLTDGIKAAKDVRKDLEWTQKRVRYAMSSSPSLRETTPDSVFIMIHRNCVIERSTCADDRLHQFPKRKSRQEIPDRLQSSQRAVSLPDRLLATPSTVHLIAVRTQKILSLSPKWSCLLFQTFDAGRCDCSRLFVSLSARGPSLREISPRCFCAPPLRPLPLLAFFVFLLPASWALVSRQGDFFFF